jgi:hypothetical protein
MLVLVLRDPAYAGVSFKGPNFVLVLVLRDPAYAGVSFKGPNICWC